MANRVWSEAKAQVQVDPCPHDAWIIVLRRLNLVRNRRSCGSVRSAGQLMASAGGYQSQLVTSPGSGVIGWPGSKVMGNNSVVGVLAWATGAGNGEKEGAVPGKCGGLGVDVQLFSGFPYDGVPRVFADLDVAAGWQP